MKCLAGKKQYVGTLRFWVALSIFLFYADLDASENSGLVLSEAEYFLSSQQLPPEQYSEKKSLPDIWRLDTRYETSPTAWYRFTLPDNAPTTAWSVLLPKFTQNIDVYFNGFDIGTSDPTRSMPINWNRPFVFELPQHYWNNESNHLDVRLTTMPNWGALAPIAVGPNDSIWESYTRAFFFQITTNQIASWMCLVLGLIALLYWLADRKNTTYGWFGLAAFCWVILAANYFLTRFPIPIPIWNVVFHSINEWFAFALVFFTHRYFKLKRPKTELAILVFALLATATYFISYFFLGQRGPIVLHIISLLIGYYNSTTAIIMTSRQFDYRKLTYALVSVSMTALFTHDNLFAQAVFGIQSPFPFYLGQLGVPLLLGFMLMVLTQDFVSELIESRRTNETLEERVNEISTELEQSYLDRQTLEREQATLKERQRIYHDIHDDLGAKLLSIVYQTKDDQTQELARSAIDDVRSIVSSSGSKSEEFFTPTQWFDEAKMRCEQAGIELQWQGPEYLALDDNSAYQITRIIRELVTNALKHSQCKKILINIELNSETLIIQVGDDGTGLTNAVAGNGSDSVRRRTKELGGEVNWVVNEDSGNGSKVSLVFPSSLINLSK